MLKKARSDITLKCKEEIFKCHRVILAALSKVFASMLKHDFKEAKEDVVDIKDCDPRAFADVIHFIYIGTLPYGATASYALFEIADKYKL